MLAVCVQALEVQVQDAENELDALEETGSFVEKASELVSRAVHLQGAAMTQTRARVHEDEQRLISVHLKHQAAQLVREDMEGKGCCREGRKRRQERDRVWDRQRRKRLQTNLNLLRVQSRI